MNQILVTKKLYITPELKRKKKIYKFEFFLSVFVLFILVSAYIYAEYDRNKSEQVSQEILENLDIPVEDDTTVADNNILVVVLNDDSEQEDEQTQNEIENTPQDQPILVNRDVQKTSTGYNYLAVATINIPKLNIKYPIIDGQTHSAAETEALLKISLTKFWGPQPNEVGNFCIVGHNYRNTKFFSKISTLEIGDTIEMTDMTGRTLKYLVYDQYVVEPTDVSCTSQLTDGKKEITLITCTLDSKHRTIIKAVEKT